MLCTEQPLILYPIGGVQYYAECFQAEGYIVAIHILQSEGGL